MKGIFIFHRDLRIDDNIGLLKACKECDKVYCIFIFTPDQVGKKNEYKSNNSVQFMCESLIELNNSLKKNNGRLSLFYGDNENVLEKLIKKYNIDAVYDNRDFSPFAKKREKTFKKLCDDYQIEYHLHEDLTLLPMGSIFTGSDTPYKVYTPFYRNAKEKKIPSPQNNNYKNYNNKKLLNEKSQSFMKTLYKYNKNNRQEGGRSNALKKLKKIKDHNDYNKKRNDPNQKNTELSAHLHFGTVSVREVYAIFKKKLSGRNELFKQLWWREFYMYITNYFLTTYQKKSFTLPKFNDIKWRYSKKDFEAWKKGMTGCPLVDAGMREMNSDGFMHNRIRMIVAMYLIYFLRIHWKEGEKYFSQKLVDIDYCNNKNWLWVAGTESFSNPYFRPFAIDSQMERFDPDAEYVKKWCPELKNVPAEDLYEWEKNYDKYPKIKYPKPLIIDMKKARKEGIKMMKTAAKN